MHVIFHCPNNGRKRHILCNYPPLDIEVVSSLLLLETIGSQFLTYLLMHPSVIFLGCVLKPELAQSEGPGSRHQLILTAAGREQACLPAASLTPGFPISFHLQSSCAARVWPDSEFWGCLAGVGPRSWHCLCWGHRLL